MGGWVGGWVEWLHRYCNHLVPPYTHRRYTPFTLFCRSHGITGYPTTKWIMRWRAVCGMHSDIMGTASRLFLLWCFSCWFIVSLPFINFFFFRFLLVVRVVTPSSNHRRPLKEARSSVTLLLTNCLGTQDESYEARTEGVVEAKLGWV